MRQKLLSILALLFIHFTAISQDMDRNVADRLRVTAEVNPKLSQTLIAYFESLPILSEFIVKATGIPSFRKEDFDFTNVFISYVKDMPGRAISARYVGESPGEASYCFTIFEHEGRFWKPMLVIANNDKSQLGYFNLSDDLKLMIKRDYGDTYTYENDFAGFGWGERNAGGGCGQAVMNCINSAYSNNGWVSVWTFLQSVFLPQTAAAIAAGCVIRNCF